MPLCIEREADGCLPCSCGYRIGWTRLGSPPCPTQREQWELENARNWLPGRGLDEQHVVAGEEPTPQLLDDPIGGP